MQGTEKPEEALPTSLLGRLTERFTALPNFDTNILFFFYLLRFIFICRRWGAEREGKSLK